MPNLALIRRRLNDKRLKFTFLRAGRRTNTVVCLCYLSGVCEQKLVAHLRRKLEELDIDSVLDANYLAERIRDHRWSPFPTLGTTEAAGCRGRPPAGRALRARGGWQPCGTDRTVPVSGMLSVQ